MAKQPSGEINSKRAALPRPNKAVKRGKPSQRFKRELQSVAAAMRVGRKVVRTPGFEVSERNPSETASGRGPSGRGLIKPKRAGKNPSKSPVSKGSNTVRSSGKGKNPKGG